METASDQNAGLTSVKGGRKERWAGRASGCGAALRKSQQV